jgi:C-terminal processing protease CtpA/Prc
MDFAGKTITLQGDLRTESVSGFAGLWLQEDGQGTVLAIDNMQKQNLHGTTGWKQYSVTLPVRAEAKQLVFGVLLDGTGKTWASHLQLLVDGKPIWKAPEAKVKKTVLETDHEFDNGSGISISKLSKVQVANLVTLGKVWGFLKYYDPTVTSGKRQWDYDLFRILPTILEAKSRKDANDALVTWIKKLGPINPCDPCAYLETQNLQLRPDLGWIKDENRLGEELSQQLQDIRKNRRVGGQFYVGLAPAGNPTFEHELPYLSITFPDAGFQLLALYRFWNIVEYWYPNRNIIGENWDEVLAEFIPRLALAKSRIDYEHQMMALIASIHDTHANLWSSIQDRPPVGACHLPVRLRYVQDRFVVTEYLDNVDNTVSASSPLRISDAIVKLDGQPVSKLVKGWAPYYGASNEAALHRQIAAFMTRGACGPTTLGILRDGHAMTIKAERVGMSPGDMAEGTWDLPGPTFRLLSPQVAYLELSSVNSDQVANDIKRAAGTKGLIIDIRNYPSQFVVFSLGDLLVDQPTPFVRFTQGDLSTPGAFHWTEPLTLRPAMPHYAGKVIVLVDGITQSQAEYTSMAFRAAGATIVGSTTAGADGNVSRVPLPGGLSALISGIGVFYPDKKPTQRVGIVPDVVVKPTIADIRAGRDPVLEKAIRLIVGPNVPEAQIRKMYQTRARMPGTSSK